MGAIPEGAERGRGDTRGVMRRGEGWGDVRVRERGAGVQVGGRDSAFGHQRQSGPRMPSGDIDEGVGELVRDGQVRNPRRWTL